MDKKIGVILCIFILFLVLFAIISTKISYHDSNEYITVAKYFAGINNVNLFSAHSIFYPLLMSGFIRIWPSDITIRIFNLTLILLMTLILYLYTKDKNTLLMFIFAPIVWIVGIQTTPVIIASICFLITYFSFQKYPSKIHIILSGIFSGLSIAFYDPMIIVIGVFMIIYFWKKDLREVFIYSILVFIGIIPRLI